MFVTFHVGSFIMLVFKDIGNFESIKEEQTIQNRKLFIKNGLNEITISGVGDDDERASRRHGRVHLEDRERARVGQRRRLCHRHRRAVEASRTDEDFRCLC